MLKKILGAVLVVMLLLAGCGGQPPASAPPASRSQAPSVAPPAPTTLSITFSNASSYIFNEIYISPTADNSWGEELLGSTRILKSNGSIEVEVPAYDYDNYDILIVDEDDDEYHFTRVPLQSGSEVAIYFGNDGLSADVLDARGNAVATVAGTLNGDGGGGTSPDPDPTPADTTDWIEFSLANGTSHILFTDLYLMPQGTTNEADMGYNHIASVAPLATGEYADIGVDNHVYFDVLLFSDSGTGWYFQGVYLEADCLAYPTNHNGAGLTVEYSDGSTAEYLAGVW